MHPEIEKLIDLALADGQITEKERNVILKKAAELGVDADEVEMTLDGKLHQLEATKTKQKEKVGNIKTCPACGASAKAMELVCSECSHEFTNTKANSTLLKLLEEIEKINKADSLIFQTERQMKEYGDKIAADKKQPIEDALAALKVEFEAKNIANLDAAMERLNNVFQAASQDMYNAGNAGGEQAQGASNDGGNPADEVTDVDFEEVEDKKEGK